MTQEALHRLRTFKVDDLVYVWIGSGMPSSNGVPQVPNAPCWLRARIKEMDNGMLDLDVEAPGGRVFGATWIDEPDSRPFMRYAEFGRPTDVPLDRLWRGTPWAP